MRDTHNFKLDALIAIDDVLHYLIVKTPEKVNIHIAENLN